MLQCYISFFDALTWFCATGQGRIHRQDSLHFQKLTLPALNEERVAVDVEAAFGSKWAIHSSSGRSCAAARSC
jgi:hypothetical protein